jgi:membrane-bound metal-dependent hydrolase YbcI (DUF457 family)
MPNWSIHLIVPLLALLIASRKENHKYILLLLPFAVLPDADTLLAQHRALLHNIFLPLIVLIPALFIKEKKTLFMIASAYLASHVLLDMFQGGVVLFYPFYNEMAFVDASLQLSKGNELLWTFDYGFTDYAAGWETAYGYITDSAGTGAMFFVFLAYICISYRNWQERRH